MLHRFLPRCIDNTYQGHRLALWLLGLLILNQFISTAVAEKMAAPMTLDYLEERAKRGSREKFLSVLAKVPDTAPDPGDEI